MRIVCALLGSRGDVQYGIPVVAALCARGHDAVIITHANFESLLQKYDVPYILLASNSERIAHGEAGRRLLRNGSRKRFHIYRDFRQVFNPHIYAMCEEAWAASAGGELVIANPIGILIMRHIAEKLGVPCIYICSFPIGKNSSYPSVFSPFSIRSPAWARRLFNRMSHDIEEYLFARLCRPHINAFRVSALGLPPMGAGFRYTQRDGEHIPVLLSISPTVAPRPRDLNPQVRMTGYWLRAMAGTRARAGAPEALSARCHAFLQRGDRPIYIGFGSMNGVFGSALLIEFAEAVIKRTGRRVVLVVGWNKNKVERESDTLLISVDEPHAALFPHMELIVHHGGASTLSAALLAGKPSVIVPVLMDQFFWGRRGYELGVAPHAIAQNRFTIEKACAAIQRALDDQRYGMRARHVQQRIMNERGLEQAVDSIEHIGHTREDAR